MGRGPSKPSEAFARAVAAEIRAEVARQRLAIADVERGAEISHNYLWKRLSDELPLNLNDVEAIANVLGVPPGVLIARAERALAAPHAEIVEFGRDRRPELPAHVPDRVAALYSEVSHHDADVEREELP
ncbi:hypothetical protein ACH473_10505 [Cellulosimicrobium funkei]|uniref:hypothetical protein n=1 Tax=Cellulosimicrobium funkei TaxID=264251 RepID=UPI0037B2C684